MAKPKYKAIVGWTNRPGYEHDHVKVLAEWDVNQTKNRRSGQGETWSRGHYVRQLGLARRIIPANPYRSTPEMTTYHIYTHSQVSNGMPLMHRPPAFVGLTRGDLERLWMEIGKELFGEKS